MGFRYSLRKKGSPFICETCTEQDKRNCLNRKGLKEVAVTKYTDEINQDLKEKSANKVVMLGDIRMYECPVSYISRDTSSLIDLFYSYESFGHLYFNGSFGEQPYWYIELLKLGKNLVNEYKKEK